MHGYFSPWNNPAMKNGPKGEFLSYHLADEASKFIKQHKDKPWFAYLAFYAVHEPISAPKELIAKFRHRRKELGLKDLFAKIDGHQWRQSQANPVYAALIYAMDKGVGKVMDTIHKLGLDKNTIVIFTSDNGGLATRGYGDPTSNLPLRAGKGWAYEGGIRVPMIVKWPGVVKPGTTNDTPVIGTDFYPTMLDMAHLPPRPKQTLDGRSIVPLLEGKSIKPRPLFWYYPHYSPQGGIPSTTVREGSWKLIDWFGRKQDVTKLFNVDKDLGESDDLTSEYAQRSTEMISQLRAWRKDVDANLPTPNKSYHPTASAGEKYQRN